MNQSDTIQVQLSTGELKNATLITVLFSEDKKEKYYVYTCDEKDTDGLSLLRVSKIEKQNGQDVFINVTDEEWGFIKKKLQNELAKGGK